MGNGFVHIFINYQNILHPYSSYYYPFITPFSIHLLYLPVKYHITPTDALVVNNDYFLLFLINWRLLCIILVMMVFGVIFHINNSNTHGLSLQSWDDSTCPHGYLQHGFIPRIDYVDLWFQFMPKSNIAASSSWSNNFNKKHILDKNTLICISICGHIKKNIKNLGHGFCA